jgi:MFS family permease
MKTLHHSEKLNKHKIFLVNIISLFMSFTGGLLIYTTSAYFKNIFNYANVGWLFLIANLLLLLALLNIHKIARAIGQEILFQLLLITKISIFTALTLTSSNISGAIFLTIFIVVEALSWVVLKMILENNATDKETGQIYGFNLMLINIGLILAPIIAAAVLSTTGFTGIFYLSIFLNLCIFMIAFFILRQSPIQTLPSTQYSKLFAKLKTRPDIQKIYSISFSLEFFFAIMVIYTPLYLLDNNFTWQQIGLLFSIMLIPLVLIPYPIGLLADKKLNEKNLLFTAFIIIIFSSLFLYFSENLTMTILMIALFISRIGASLINILRLSYFYKRIDRNDIGMISIFYTARPLAFIIAPALAGITLLFFPLNSIFILLALVASLALFPTIKLPKNI